MNKRRLLARVAGNPAGARFEEMRSLVEAFGFQLARVKGSHHIYTRLGVPELVNLQNVGGMAKAYQVRQFLKIVERRDLNLEESL